MKHAASDTDTKRLLTSLAARVYAEGEPASIEDGPYCPRCLSGCIRTGHATDNGLLASLAVFFLALRLPLPRQHLCENCGLRWPI